MIRNILINFIKPNYAIVILRKLLKRLERDSASEALIWAEKNKTDMDAFFKKINPDLWTEARDEFSNVKKYAARKLSSIEPDLGGGGSFPLLYFLCRHHKPDVVVETGVAAGWSSVAFLSAMQKNKKGMLYSSDFPYFRLKNPEKYIGVLVKKELRESWVLDITGDSNALPKIAGKIEKLDIFHYDSDKSLSGRKFALNELNEKFHARSLIIMDDIQDNIFFRDFVKSKNFQNFHVFEFEGKYVGLVGAGPKLS